MADDPNIQLLTFLALMIGIFLPLLFPKIIKKLIFMAAVLLFLGFILFLMLVIIQSSEAIIIFYVSMFFWMTGLILMIHALIQKNRRRS